MGDVVPPVWSPDSRWFAATSNFEISIWDASAGKWQQNLRGHTAPIRNAASWDADGRHLVSAGQEDKTCDRELMGGAELGVGLPTGDAEGAYVTRDGRLETTGPDAERRFTYVVERPDGEQKLYAGGSSGLAADGGSAGAESIQAVREGQSRSPAARS